MKENGITVRRDRGDWQRLRSLALSAVGGPFFWALRNRLFLKVRSAN
jgi:hypothetical protein